jgi:hypothetical protein
MLISLAKAVGLKAIDVANRWHDPFDEFTRPPYVKTTHPLHLKAAWFEADFVQNFRLPNGLWNYKRPAAGGLLDDVGDQATWSGIYTAFWAIKYSVTHSSNDSYELFEAVKALDRLRFSTVHKSWQRVLIRGYDPARLDRTTGVFDVGAVRDDASNDSLTGHFAGIYFAWKHGDEPTRRLAAGYLHEICEELMAGDFAIHRIDGTPTTYGQLINGIATDPLRLTLCLAILKAGAAAVSPALQTAYEKLWKRYGVLTAYAQTKFLWLTKSHEAHRAALHLSILADLERYTPWKNTYVDGLRRIWALERKTGNAWINYLVQRHWQTPLSDFQTCVKVLREFEVEEKGPNVERINSADETYWNEKGVRFFKWGKYVRASQPLPKWKIGSQDFFWQRSAYSVDDWLGNSQPTHYHNGGDFLIAYWGLRQLGMIKGDQ